MIRKYALAVLAASGVLVASFLFGGCAAETETVQDVPAVKTMVVSRYEPGGAVYAGEVRGRYESRLAFQAGGKISARHVSLGSVVRAGDSLFEIDAKDILENARIAAAQAESAKSNLKLAEANADRCRRLYEEGAASRAQYEQYQTNYDAALAAYRQAEAQYAQSKNSLGYANLTADADGVISEIGAEVGQVVAAGQSVATLVRLGELEAEIFTPENRMAQMRVGAPMTVSFWALGETARGEVREISPAADPAARTYKTRIRLIDPPPGVELGMTASVSADGETGAAPRLAVPLSAIYQTGERPQVWTVENGTARLKDVTVEAFGGDRAVISEGIAEGDVVVAAGVHKLREGQRVRLAGETQ